MKDNSHNILSRAVAEVLPSAETLAKLMDQKKIRVYLGIDPTGSLLTLGHSVGLRKLQQFADLGHEAILLVGSGTVRIGDPTGRDSTRPELSDQEIKANFKDWQKQASKILDFSKIKVVYNGDWLDKLNYQDIVKLLAKTTVQQLIERDMFQERLKNGLPIHGHEIIYPLLQGYDSVHLDVDLEIGGTDQTFNMMMGRALQKAYHNRDKWVLTTPIINGTDGRKMSKSFNNFVALTERPNDMYGQLMRISDDQIIPYLTVLTDLPMERIDQMEQRMKAGDNPMEFKKQLAHQITRMYHSAEAANQAAAYFQSIVQNREVGEAQPFKVEEKQGAIIDILRNAPTNRSRNDLRRLTEQGGISIFFTDGSQAKAEADKIYQVKEIDKIKVGKREFFKVV